VSLKFWHKSVIPTGAKRSGEPALSEVEWGSAVSTVGAHRNLKNLCRELRLDADVIAWLKKDGKGYQTRANRVLREKMLKEMAG
jgi:uncharacterized protein (DUF4415 family)